MFIENDFELNDFLHTLDFKSLASTFSATRADFIFFAEKYNCIFSLICQDNKINSIFYI